MGKIKRYYTNKRGERLLKIRYYTPVETKTMADVLKCFPGGMNEYNAWYDKQNDPSITNWTKAAKRLKDTQYSGCEEEPPKPIAAEEAPPEPAPPPPPPPPKPAEVGGKKKARSFCGLDEKEIPSTYIHTGIFNAALREAVPQYNKATSETIIKGANNTMVILGRDRCSGKASGYGGRGDTQAGAIDFVVGLMAPEPREYINGQKISADKNFRTDAARIYMSQKTDIDRCFDLSEGQVGNSIARSGIGIKADAVRIIAREGIKLVTGTDSHNSQGGKVDTMIGIDLIAHNSGDQLQPIPKGQYLVNAIIKLSEHLGALNGILMGVVMNQDFYNKALLYHHHNWPDPVTQLPMTTSPIDIFIPAGILALKTLNETTASLTAHRSNLNTYRSNYLSQGGDFWILSRHNNTN